ncbi:retrotransposon protein, putative, ty1-copia subclass [Tanacetum coccineum]
MARKPSLMQVKGTMIYLDSSIVISARIPRAPKRYGFYIDDEEYKLGDHGEPPNYQAALSDPESKKWLEAMNAEMQSMKDNQVWTLVDLLPNCNTVRSKWLFKKKTDMYGNIHTYKARLVAKGNTQTYEVDYEETFSPVTNIKAIRILIAIAAYYDYDICILDKHASFKDLFVDLIKLLGVGTRDLMRKSKSIVSLKIPMSHMDTSKRGTIPMQPNVDLSKAQGPSTLAEVMRMKGIPYASAVGSLMYAVSLVLLATLTLVGRLIGTTFDLGWVEYIAASEAAMEVIWIRKFIYGLGVVPNNDRPMDINYDNTGTITIVDEHGIQKGAKPF